MATDSLKVVIIGAGATGLALAQGLRKENVPCIVFEQDESLTSRSRDWNMGLHWGAASLESLITVEAWSRIQEVQVDRHVSTKPLDTLKFINGATGETLGQANIDYFYRLMRSKLRVMLADGIGVQYGKKLVELAPSWDGEKVDLKFEDGSTYTGLMVIGCDGPRSVVRRLAVTSPVHAEPRRIPYGATFAQARFTKEQAEHLRSFHPLFLAGVHPMGRFSFFGMQDADKEDEPETWLFFFYISFRASIEEQDAMSKWTPNQHMTHIKSLAKDFADPWKSAFEWLPDDHPLNYMGMADWDPSTPEHEWGANNVFNGRVTLAGDAAHLMTYQRGQGLNHSMTDAAKLVPLLSSVWKGKKEPKVAVKEYEDEMKVRAGTEVRMGTENTMMLHDWGKVLQSPLFKAGLNKSSGGASTTSAR